MMLGEFLPLEQHRVSIAPVQPENSPPLESLDVYDEWLSTADAFVLIEERLEGGNIGVMGEDWCFSIWRSESDYGSTLTGLEALAG